MSVRFKISMHVPREDRVRAIKDMRNLFDISLIAAKVFVDACEESIQAVRCSDTQFAKLCTMMPTAEYRYDISEMEYVEFDDRDVYHFD